MIKKKYNGAAWQYYKGFKLKFIKKEDMLNFYKNAEINKSKVFYQDQNGLFYIKDIVTYEVYKLEFSRVLMRKNIVHNI